MWRWIWTRRRVQDSLTRKKDQKSALTSASKRGITANFRRLAVAKFAEFLAISQLETSEAGQPGQGAFVCYRQKRSAFGPAFQIVIQNDRLRNFFHRSTRLLAASLNRAVGIFLGDT